MSMSVERYERLAARGNVVLRGHGGEGPSVVASEGEVDVVKARGGMGPVRAARRAVVRDRSVELPELKGVGVRVW